MYGILAVILFVLPLAGVAQEKPGPADEVFSPLAWKSDTLGTNGYRARMKYNMKVYGKSKAEIMEMLGAPDSQEEASGPGYPAVFIYFFEYYLSPNYRKQSATRSWTELRNGTLKEDLGSCIILEFDEEGKVSGARVLWSCG